MSTGPYFDCCCRNRSVVRDGRAIQPLESGEFGSRTLLSSADNTAGQVAKRRTRATIRVLSLVLSAPCFAGDLEDGVRLYDQKRYAPSVTAFERAAVGGNVEAQRRLGFMYYHGEGVAQNNQRAVTLFETSASAADILSASNLGMMYEHGMGVDQDDARAASWYRADRMAPLCLKRSSVKPSENVSALGF